jgi:hypothetical protein
MAADENDLGSLSAVREVYDPLLPRNPEVAPGAPQAKHQPCLV